MTRFVLFAVVLVAIAVIAITFWSRLPASRAVSEARPASDLSARPGRLIVDIREPDEWKDTGVLAGARLHSWRSAQKFAAAFGDDLASADEILLVCRSGNRSSRAARALAAHLEREVIDVAGGMLRLSREGTARTVAPTREMGCTVC